MEDALRPTQRVGPAPRTLREGSALGWPGRTPPAIVAGPKTEAVQLTMARHALAALIFCLLGSSRPLQHLLGPPGSEVSRSGGPDLVTAEAEAAALRSELVATQTKLQELQMRRSEAEERLKAARAAQSMRAIETGAESIVRRAVALDSLLVPSAADVVPLPIDFAGWDVQHNVTSLVRSADPSVRTTRWRTASGQTLESVVTRTDPPFVRLLGTAGLTHL